MLNTLYFRTAGIAAIYLLEIRGQITDGYYENSDLWDSEQGDILEDFVNAEIEVAGEKWKRGLQTSDGRISCPVSGIEALESVLSFLNEETHWPYRVGLYYALGEKYGIELVKKMSANRGENAVEALALYLWHIAGDDHVYKTMIKDRRLTSLFDINELCEFLKSLDPKELIDKVESASDELDEVLDYQG